MNRFARWLTRATSFWSDKLQWGGVFMPTPATSGITVTPDTALSLTAAFAAINVISTDVASLPLKVYRRRADGGRDEVRDHPVSDLFAYSPDGETTSMRWRQAAMGHVLGWGNGYAEIGFDGAGRPAGLYLLDPGTTRAERRAQDKRLYYRAKNQTLPPYRVLHFAGLGFNGLEGYSPIGKAREAVGLAMAAEQFGASLFGNGSRPSGLLKTPQKLDENAAKRLRESWESIHRGSANGNRVAVLEQGLEWQQVSINPEDAQFLATRQFQVVEIARLYRLPPHKIGDYTQSHRANIEESNLDYLTTTIAPWCEAVEQEINLKLFTAEERAAGFYVEHDMRAFLRGDMKARAEFYTKLRDLGVYSPNEVRALENLNPLGPEGDIRLVPLNMVSLEQAGKEPEPPPAPAPPPTGDMPDPEPEDEDGPEDDAEDDAEDDTDPPTNGRASRFTLNGNGHHV